MPTLFQTIIILLQLCGGGVFSFELIEERTKFVDANSKCRQQFNTDLASIHTYNEFITVKKLIADASAVNVGWIGAVHGAVDSDGSYTKTSQWNVRTNWNWVDGSEFEFAYWGQGQGHSAYEYNGCIGAWTGMQDCGDVEEYYLVCNSPDPTRHTFVVGPNIIRSWTDSEQHCSTAHQTTLAIINDESDKTEAIRVRLASDQSDKHTWIGLNDMTSDKSWSWVNGDNCGGDCKNLAFWAPNEPSGDGGSVDHCGAMYAYPNNDFNDYVCYYYSGYQNVPLCEAPIDTTIFRG